jgi:hypothetical protein
MPLAEARNVASARIGAPDRCQIASASLGCGSRGLPSIRADALRHVLRRNGGRAHRAIRPRAAGRAVLWAGAARGECGSAPWVAAGSRGDASVRVGERVLWRAQSRGTRVVSDVVWSRAGDAVAYATRNRTGGMLLVVVMVGGDADAHPEVVTWTVPPRAIKVRRLAVF